MAAAINPSLALEATNTLYLLISKVMLNKRRICTSSSIIRILLLFMLYVLVKIKNFLSKVTYWEYG